MTTNKLFKRIGFLLFQVVVFLLLPLSFSLLWAKANFSGVSYEEVLYHLNIPLEEASTEMITSYITTALFPTVLLFLIWLFLIIWPSDLVYHIVIRFGQETRRIRVFPLFLSRPRKRLQGVAAVIWFAALLFCTDRMFGLQNLLDSQIGESEIIAAEYVDPQQVSITFPEKKRNLICIYMESAESSNQDTANGGLFDVNYTPEMTALAKDNISFSQSELLEGASVAPACGWTIAGLIAQTSGLPLKFYQTTYFMPNATTLGDLLEREGYHNVFLAGSRFSFGGRKSYFTQHGSYEIFDYTAAVMTEKIPADYMVWWGFEDQKLYAFAQEKLTELAAEDEPFCLSLLTVDTHTPAGYVCDICPNLYDEQYGNVWACASKQVWDFVSWIQQQDFYENTTIVITGDHCSMDPDFYGDNISDIYKGGGSRKVYNAFINSAVTPANEKNRKFTTLDIFPSTLASIGVEIEGDRLGLGTNLFSGKETLSEQYGYDTLFRDLRKRSPFYNENILGLD